jgi:hypothetical protein
VHECKISGAKVCGCTNFVTFLGGPSYDIITFDMAMMWC